MPRWNRGPALNAGQPGFTLEELDLLSQDSRDWLLSGAAAGEQEMFAPRLANS
jgi:hypothetical protein